MSEVHAILEQISTHYSPLSPEVREQFARRARLRSVQKGEQLVHEGQHAHQLYFIVEGSIRVYYLKDGRDTTDWMAFEHDFVSSIVSFFEMVPSPHYMEAMEDGLLLEISRADIFQLMEEYRELECLSNVVLTKTVLQLQHRVVSIQFETAQQRYKNLLEVRPDITQRVPLTHIASYLGITLETLSRVRSQLAKG